MSGNSPRARAGSILTNAIHSRGFPLVLLSLTLAASLATGFAGLDFGQHWDEGYIFDELAKSFRNGLFLPRRYNYPSATYDLALLGTAPFVLLRFAAGDPDASIGALRESGTLFKSQAFLLFTRGVFLFVSVGMTAIWTFLLIRASGRGRWEALVGAAILATSWEVAYHARWIAPDGVLMQFGALTMFLVMTAFRSERIARSRWLMLAAVSAGLACGSKYFGGILLVPVLLAAAIPDGRPRAGLQSLGQVLALTSAFAAAFLLSTPGAFLEPFSFVTDVRREVTHYQTGHFGNSVAAGWQHGWLLAQYLATETLSAWTPVAATLSALAVVGLVVALQENGGVLRTVLLLCAPFIFVLYMVTQRVMIARNYLLLVPFLAVLAARGIAHTARHATPVALRSVATGLTAVLIALNLGWLERSAHSIAEAASLDQGAALARYLSENDQMGVCLSAYVQGLLEKEASLSNLVGNADRDVDCMYVFSTTELPLIEESGSKWLANRPGRYQLVVGANDRNFDYYPWWPGDHKIIAIRYSDARNSGLIEASGS